MSFIVFICGQNKSGGLPPAPVIDFIVWESRFQQQWLVFYTHSIHVHPCPVLFFSSTHPLKNIFLVTMNNLRQQIRRGSHKAHVNNHLISSHLLPSLMRELTAFLNGEHAWTCLMLHHAITASTCNVPWLSFSCGTCWRVCHRSGVMNGCRHNPRQPWLQHRFLG